MKHHVSIIFKIVCFVVIVLFSNVLYDDFFSSNVSVFYKMFEVGLLIFSFLYIGLVYVTGDRCFEVRVWGVKIYEIPYTNIELFDEWMPPLSYMFWFYNKSGRRIYWIFQMSKRSMADMIVEVYKHNPKVKFKEMFYKYVSKKIDVSLDNVV